MNCTGTILLRRKSSDYKVGFCLVDKDFVNLITEMDFLSLEELKYYAILKFERRKESYLLGRFAAKNAISQVLTKKKALPSFSIKFGVFQFPVVEGLLYPQNIQVSISHCDTIGIAFAFPEAHPLGIDIEKINEEKIETIKSMICDRENDQINSCALDMVIGSTMVWTIKESLSKILKTGLMLDFKLLEIESLEEEEGSFISTFTHFSQYKAVSRQVGDYMCSIVIPKNTFFESADFWNRMSKFF